MNCVKKYSLLYCLLLLSFSLPLRAQYGWNFQYAGNNITTHWRHLASGDTTVIASFRFSLDDKTDTTEYYLKGFRPRPITNSTTGWFVDELQLYLDRGNEGFGRDDSLISGGFTNSIPRQSEPDTSIILNFGGDSLLLINNCILFIVAIVHDWRDEDPENLEIDTTAGGPYGKWFSIKVFQEDLTVSPTGSNDITRPAVVQFAYQAINLPVTIRNELASSAEDDSPRRNMFYPNFLSLDGASASKVQRIDDLSFYADIFMPESNDSIELSIKSASLQFGFDNRMLEFESVEYGDVWGKDSWFYVDTSLTQVELFDADYPEYTIFQYNAQFNGSETVNTNYKDIDSSSIIRLKFNVIAPGVSPIFIQNIDLRDRWGVRYHTYQNLQNYAPVESGMTGERHDAWAKYVLGDFTFSGGDGVSPDGVCDGLVTWEDVALFSDYIWLNSADSRWYKRFDVASANSISPTDYCPDDTTNFYDLMVIAANYHRTFRGAFNQKPVTRGSDTLEMRLVSEDFSGEWQMRIQLQNVSGLQSAHLVVRFNPEELQYIAHEPGAWTSGVVENCLLLVPEAPLAKGTIDINFVALDQSLSGAGEFLRLNFRKLQSQATTPEIIISDFRDSNCRSLLAVQTSEPEITIPLTFRLLQNFPNPFNARTQIAYTVPEPEGDHYTITIYDLCGKRVVTLADAFHGAGSYRLQWNGCDREGQAVASGIYFLCLKNSYREQRKKMMLLR